MTGRGSNLVTVEQAAQLWRVAARSVYNWIDAGLLTCFERGPDGPLVATRDGVRRAQVLRKNEVRNLGVDQKLLSRALRTNVVSGRDGRFSLEDVEAVLALGGAAEAPMQTVAPVRRQSGFAVRAFHWTQEDEVGWVACSADPAQLPDGYFDLPGPPRFIGPADVWRYTPDARVPGRPGERYVRRSAGYENRDGVLVWCEENDQFARIRAGEPMPQEWVESNRAYRLAEERWAREAYRRQHKERGSG
jgi:hypothetical protein